jgi:putative pyruvate formate lyase activating enzyme
MLYNPPYVKLYEDGTLKKRTERVLNILQSCTLCPHRCGVDRTESKSGRCRSGVMPIVSSCNAHFGEESPLVGRHGSGTIFLTNCNLSCIFCQNYDISHLGRGEEVSYRDLASMMLKLQSSGCHNINFVTPTHMVSAILKALLIAIPEGLHIPLVYNSGGYDSVETLELLDGIIDIYMPDFKYMDPDNAEELSGARDYPEVATAALREMHSQVGDLELDKNGTALRGLLIRHLVLPNNLASTDRVISFIAQLSKNTYLNIMDQYRPEYRARECPDIRRRITLQEYDDAINQALQAGLNRIDGYGRKYFL